jgi:hypothetical protein
MDQINLTPEEAFDLTPKIQRLEGMALGYAQGIEAAKQLIVRDFLEKRKVPNGPIAQPQHEPAGYPPVRASQPVPQSQSAGDAEPERPATPDDAERSAFDGTIGDAGAFDRTLFPIRGTSDITWPEPGSVD